jgi:hypothetical protein
VPLSVRLGAVTIAGTLALTLVFATRIDVASQEFGSITFPTSGAPAAQEAFLTGVKALHNFQFDEAAVIFQQAEKADPAFAMAYWGEAMSHNHPLWAQQDVEKAKQALDKLDPTPEGRLAKAKLPKEKAFFEAIQTLYFSPGDKLARDNAYSAAMARMSAQWPDDNEISILYALSLLGTVRPGDTGFRGRRSPRRSPRRFTSRIRSTLAQRTSSSIRSTIPIMRRWPVCRRRLREDRPVGRACASHAVAHLRPTRDVAEGVASNVDAYKAATS